METLETVSNCSMLSDGSEYPHSNVSSLSGLSSYEDELRELKRLISIDPIHNLKHINKSPSNSSESSIEAYSNNSKLNNTFKNHLNIDWKLESHKKIDKLIKHNTFLESELKNANDRLRDVLKNNITFNGSYNNANLRNQIVSLEKTNFEYNLQIQVLKKEVLYWQDQLETSENCKRSLEKEFVEVSQDNKLKANCVNELKKKICQQHTDIHNLKQENVKLNNNILSLENDLDRLKKSEDWYKSQLHKNQAVKQDILNECSNLKVCNAARGKKIESLTFELNKWKSSCDELRSTLKEIKQQSNNYMQQITAPISTCNENKNEKLKAYYEAIISDLGNEIDRIKQSVQEHNITFDEINKEKFGLDAQVTILQKKLNEKEIAIHTLQNENGIINTKLMLAYENLNESEKNYISTKNKKAALEVELLALSKEKEMTEESVTTIREDLNKLISKYKSLQQQIHSKDIYIKQLEKEKLNVRVDKNRTSCSDYVLYIFKEFENYITCLHQNFIELEKNTLNSPSLILNSCEQIIAKCKGDIYSCKNILQQISHQSDLFKMQHQIVPDENNYINDIIKILETVCFNLNDLCEGNLEKCNINNLPENSIIQCDKNVQNLLQSINIYIEKLYSFKKKYYKEKQEFCANSEEVQYSNNARKALISRLQKLENKCSILTKNNEESYGLLKLISSRNNVIVQNNMLETEEIKHLKAQIKANEIEMKEKQMRFETNNRTLLRKVKEHMRGRKEAEKHCTQLQQLYDNLLSQYNMLRLQLSDMENEINIQGQNDCYIDHKCTTNNNTSSAHRCSECDSKCEQIKYLEKELLNINERYKQVVKEKDNNIIELETKLQKLSHELSSLENERKMSNKKCEEVQLDLTKCNDTLKELEILLDETQKRLQSTEDNLLEAVNKCSDQTLSIKNYESLLKDITEKNEFLSKEVESLSGNLHQKNEELLHLQQKHSVLTKEASSFQKTLSALQSDLQSFKSDMNVVTNDKHFLQRICNDLKFALHSSLNQNKVLKEQLQNLSSSRKEYYSLPDEFLSLPNVAPPKYDETYICKLLEQTNDPSHELLDSIQNNLHLLKQELSVLQMRINEKNYIAH